MKQLIKMIDQSEKDWETLPHWICPKCKTEILLRDKEDHEKSRFLCNEIIKISKEEKLNDSRL